MHKKPPHNPYEPSVRERLAQRDNAVRMQAYTCTGKRKYCVYKPVNHVIKKVNSYIGAISAGNTNKYLLFSNEYGGLTQLFVEEKWLTERQATMVRLKGYVVEEA